MMATEEIGPADSEHAETALEILKTVDVPGGRADFTNPQKIALAQVYATLELARQQRISNYMAAISGSAAAVEHDPKPGSTNATAARIQWRNRLRARVRAALGL